MNRSGAEITSSPFTSKFVQDRLAHVEKYFGDLCVSFNSYTRKTAKIRDKGKLPIHTCSQMKDMHCIF
uniref:Uncharacterized protein n=1 Tax=Octopus bimaculoides TaxID=37653 RepID=A0A0L8G445_OCTBM